MTTLAVASLPAVETWAADIKAKGGPSPDDQAKVQEAVTKALNEPGARDVVLGHIKGLSQGLERIENNFTAIATVLSGIDAKQIVRVDGNVYLLHPGWQSLHKRYAEILVSSFTSATEVNFRVKTLLEVIGASKDHALTVQERKETVLEYKDDIAQYAEKEKKIVADLLLLSSDIVTYKDVLIQRLKDQAVMASDKINELEGKIDQVRRDLADSKPQGVMGTVLGVFGFNFDEDDSEDASLGRSDCAGLAGLIQLIPGIGPIAAGASLVSMGLNFVGGLFGGNERKEKRQYLRALLEEKRQEEARLGELNKAIEEVKGLEDHFTSLLDQIRILTQINQLLLMDATNLVLALDKLGNAKTNGMARTYMNLLGPVYKALSESLTEYVLATPNYLKKPVGA